MANRYLCLEVATLVSPLGGPLGKDHRRPELYLTGWGNEGLERANLGKPPRHLLGIHSEREHRQKGGIKWYPKSASHTHRHPFAGSHPLRLLERARDGLLELSGHIFRAAHGR